MPDEIKESLIEGHLETCVPTIKSQLEQGYSTSKIKRYCYCLGNAYFNEFSFKDYDYLSKYLKLPPRIDNIRYKLQINCGDKYLEWIPIKLV